VNGDVGVIEMAGVTPQGARSINMSNGTQD